jgi:hypothetical protein
MFSPSLLSRESRPSTSTFVRESSCSVVLRSSRDCGAVVGALVALRSVIAGSDLNYRKDFPIENARTFVETFRDF